MYVCACQYPECVFVCVCEMSALLSPHGGDRGIESAWMKREGRERGMERDRGREKEKERGSDKENT